MEALVEGLLCKAFWAALLLTGDEGKAEEVVQAAIEYLDADELSSEALLILVSTLGLQLDGDDSVPDGNGSVPPALPDELRNVMRLPRVTRQCYVLRVLLGFTEDRSARLIHVEERHISDEVGVAMCELAAMSVSPSWPTSQQRYRPRGGHTKHLQNSQACIHFL